MKILVPVKRVIDYNIKVRVKADNTGVDLANVKMAMMYSPPWDGDAWTWESYVTVWRGVAKLTWWPGF